MTNEEAVAPTVPGATNPPFVESAGSLAPVTAETTQPQVTLEVTSPPAQTPVPTRTTLLPAVISSSTIPPVPEPISSLAPVLTDTISSPVIPQVTHPSALAPVLTEATLPAVVSEPSCGRTHQLVGPGSGGNNSPPP